MASKRPRTEPSSSTSVPVPPMSKNEAVKEELMREANLLQLHFALVRHGLECTELQTLQIKDFTLTSESADKVVGLALSHHASQSRLVLSPESILHGIQFLHPTHHESKKFFKDIVFEDEYEKRVLDNVITPSDIGVTFDDIGALEDVKDALKKLVMLPIQRPELFSKGKLTKPCRGILLFGPPGTGKTMLAKAIATEAGANFINISLSSITSKLNGEEEKFVKAIFSVARKISPSVIFVDEADCMLSHRGNPRESEKLRKLKSEFLVNWDGLLTKNTDQVLVLAATSRPFELDEAVIRRLPRRLMVNLPDAPNRAKILKVILANEDVCAEVNLDTIAEMTDGFSGNDLHNLCETASNRAIEVLHVKASIEAVVAQAEGRPAPEPLTPDNIRSLSMDDFRYAHQRVRASLPSQSENMIQLAQWAELHGECASKKKVALSYFI